MSDLSFNNFDWNFYINKYSDLKLNGINTKEKAWKHWQTYGIKEKRISIPSDKIINNTTKNTIKCSILTMNKNEKDLLEAWIVYYSNLFSFDNICIVDNNSTDTHVLEILDKYKNKGVNVIYNYKSPKDFLNKGTILKNLAQKLYSDSDFVFF